MPKVLYPDFKVIVKLVTAEIKSQYKKYKNSWKDISYTGFNPKGLQWWHKRLKGEVKELEKAKSDGERREELLDIIAVSSFMLQNLHDKGDFTWNDPWWRYP